MDSEKKSENRINIAIALNRKALQPAYVMLRSLAINNASHFIYVYVLQSELEDRDCLFLQDALQRDIRGNSIKCIKIDAAQFSVLPHAYWPVEAYYRLMLPKLLGGEIDRILFLDIDIIVNKDIWDFYYTDFEGNLLVAAKDAEFDKRYHRGMALNTSKLDNWKVFWRGLVEDGMKYFCSGVLLMNLAELKKEYSFQKYVTTLASIAENVGYPDQDLLNYMHYRQVKIVDENKFGLVASIAHEMGMSYEDVQKKVYILHFAGPYKPYRTAEFRYDIEKIWWEYAKDSPFYQELLETVFYQSMEHCLTEEKLLELKDENGTLKEMLGKCQKLIQQLSSRIQS